MSERRHPNVVNLDEVQPTESANGRFVYQHRALARAVGARQIGCGLVEIPPGKTAWPHHWHCANEEAMYVVSGTGTARIGDARVAIRAGDYLAFPVGPACAHQTTNTGTEPLVYLVFSTMHTTEVVGYPDSKKLGAASVEVAADGNRKPVIRALFKDDTQVGYFDGETLEE
jgi:uncharacterized cupin superfamily protein